MQAMLSLSMMLWWLSVMGVLALCAWGLVHIVMGYEKAAVPGTNRRPPFVLTGAVMAMWIAANVVFASCAPLHFLLSVVWFAMLILNPGMFGVAAVLAWRYRRFVLGLICPTLVLLIWTFRVPLVEDRRPDGEAFHVYLRYWSDDDWLWRSWALAVYIGAVVVVRVTRRKRPGDGGGADKSDPKAVPQTSDLTPQT